MGISFPLNGLVAITPSKRTPVFSFVTSVRSNSDFARAAAMYSFTASTFLILPSSNHFFYQRMFRGNYTECNTKNSVNTCRINGHLVFANHKIDIRPI